MGRSAHGNALAPVMNFLIMFEQEALAFSFFTGPPNYVDSPVETVGH